MFLLGRITFKPRCNHSSAVGQLALHAEIGVGSLVVTRPHLLFTEVVTTPLPNAQQQVGV